MFSKLSTILVFVALISVTLAFSSCNSGGGSTSSGTTSAGKYTVQAFASPTEVGPGGSSTVTCKVFKGDIPAPDGTNVTFSASSGYLGDPSSGDPGTNVSFTATTKSGMAYATYKSAADASSGRNITISATSLGVTSTAIIKIASGS